MGRIRKDRLGIRMGTGALIVWSTAVPSLHADQQTPKADPLAECPEWYGSSSYAVGPPLDESSLEAIALGPVRGTGVPYLVAYFLDTKPPNV